MICTYCNRCESTSGGLCAYCQEQQHTQEKQGKKAIGELFGMTVFEPTAKEEGPTMVDQLETGRPLFYVAGSVYEGRYFICERIYISKDAAIEFCKSCANEKYDWSVLAAPLSEPKDLLGRCLTPGSFSEWRQVFLQPKVCHAQKEETTV